MINQTKFLKIHQAFVFCGKDRASTLFVFTYTPFQIVSNSCI